MRPDRGCVVVLNHQHSLDVLALFHLWPEMLRCTTLAKRELLYFTGPFGWAAWLCGTTFIDRNKGQVRQPRNLGDLVGGWCCRHLKLKFLLKKN